MPTQNSSKDKVQAKRAGTEAKKSAAATASAGKRAAAAEKNQVQAVAETAVDLPVGAVLTVSDRLSELVEPWTDRSKAEKQLKSYRSQLGKTLKRTERRGTSARRKATTEARKTRTRVEREARRRQRTLKRNRSQVEQRVRRAVDEQTSRAQDLVSQVTDQLSALR